jgi:3-oxoacyl-[acyl-carrier-protein] synthase II
VFIGTALGGANATEEAHRDIWYHGAPPKPLSVLCAMNNAPAAHLSIRFSLRGPNITYSVACASSAIAIGDAFHAIRDGRIACALAGGAEACVTPVVLRAWRSMRILASVDTRQPGAACKPFSINRSGLVLGEGAAMVVLEPMEHALARGATVLCEILGFGGSTDGSHICIPSTDGQCAAIEAALEDARISPADVRYINAHGTGTRVGDLAETRAIRQVFGDQALSIATSSTKSAHGHLLGASGALELIASLSALRAGFYPATLNLREPDPECDLGHVPNEPRGGARLDTFLTNSFAFGGSNAVLIAGEPR